MVGRLATPCSGPLLLLGAAVFHVLFTLAIYAAGHLAISPLFDANGFSTTVILDNADYLPEVLALSEILREEGVGAWLFSPLHHHLKPYALGFAALQPWLGPTILCAEPVNLLCYIAILLLTFTLGKEVFGRPTGLVAAGAVAVWPSFLLHTTQLLKDPLFIAALLSLLLVFTCCLTRSLPLRAGLWNGLGGAAAICLIRFTRHYAWSPIIFALVAIGTGLLLARLVRERRFLAGNVLSVVLVLSAMGVVLLAGKQGLQAGAPPQHAVARDASLFAALKQRADSAAIQISRMRNQFVRKHTNVSPAKDAGSNIDTAVRFNSAMDVVRYLPRAAMIGFLAPFPDQWFAEGKKAGLAGRFLSGLEMSVMYLIEALVLIELWRSRSRLPVWLLFGVAAVGSRPWLWR